MKKGETFELDGVNYKVSTVNEVHVYAGKVGKKGRPSKFVKAELEAKLNVVFEVTPVETPAVPPEPETPTVEDAVSTPDAVEPEVETPAVPVASVEPGLAQTIAAGFKTFFHLH